MSDTDPPIIEYASPSQQARNNVLWQRLIPGILAGGCTFALASMSDGLVTLVSCVLCGVVLGFVSARQSRSNGFFAGAFGYLTALAAFACIVILKTMIRGQNPYNGIDLGSIAGVAIFLSPALLIPAVLSNVWMSKR